MDRILCASSAFHYHRIPPHIREALGPPPPLEGRAALRALSRRGSFMECIPLPLDLLSTDASQRRHALAFRRHLISASGLERGCEMVDASLAVASPEVTLLSLARSAPFHLLCMAAHEMCGTFSVFHPSAELAAQLECFELPSGWRGSGWRPFLREDGSISGLWSRPALTCREDLRHLASQVEGVSGRKKLLQVAEHVRDGAASPLEVQVAMLLGLPRTLGGAGISGITLNEPIRLNRAARRIARRETCYGDVCVEPVLGGRPVIVECQSAWAHDNAESFVSDSDRKTALELMGYAVVLVTAHQVRDMTIWHDIVRHVGALAGVPVRFREKWDEREWELRRSLFMDWKDLFR